MTALTQQKIRVVLQDGAECQPLDAASRFDLLNTLLDQGLEVMSSGTADELAESQTAPTVHLGQFITGIPADLDQEIGHRTRDISGLDALAVIDVVEEMRSSAKIEKASPWKPWFPVIDYDRCTNCMQCLSFCLFDVYGVDKGEQIQVQNNDNCKTDCPACSRVCPEVAILFPKYNKGPINGDVVRESDIQREAMKVDVSALLGGNIYESLRNRQSDARKRFSTERDESRALLERKKCLKKLKKDFDIPDEVLMSLPGVGDIEERAERAKAKMAQRLARSQTAKDLRPPASQEEWGI